MRHFIALYCLLIAGRFAFPDRPEEGTFFTERVWPILRDNCFKCHGDARTRNGLDVSTREDLLKGGEHGPAIVPGDPEKSLLLRSARYEGDYHMPPKGKLSPEKIADLTEWIKRGASWGATK